MIDTKRPFVSLALLTGALALAACGGDETGREGASSISLADAREQSSAGEASEGEGSAAIQTVVVATPMEERVATIGLLNKRNNVSQDLELRPGEIFEEGPVIVRLSACERTAPWEMPQETGAFVQLDVLERGESDHTRVFSGWLFKQSPSLNVVEHPIYDVWVKDCMMSFPGEEAPAG